MPAYRGWARRENTSFECDKNVSMYTVSLSLVLTTAFSFFVIPDLVAFFAQATLCLWLFGGPSQAAR